MERKQMTEREVYDSFTDPRVMADINTFRLDRLDQLTDRAREFSERCHGREYSVFHRSTHGGQQEIEVNENWWKGVGLIAYGLMNYQSGGGEK